jgi:protein-ribulosamine 3-kinase
LLLDSKSTFILLCAKLRLLADSKHHVNPKRSNRVFILTEVIKSQCISWGTTRRIATESLLSPLMFSQLLKTKIEAELTAHKGEAVAIHGFESATGGCINEAASLQTNHGSYFVKWNSIERYPGMFEAEAKGLNLLTETNAIHIPKVVGVGQAGNWSFLLLEHLEPSFQSLNFWENFGRAVAELHQNTNAQFGLDHNNYIGSLPQDNKWHGDWVSFFVEQRLEAQVRTARNDGGMSSARVRNFERLYQRLDEIFPQEKPALLHGDLWSGNFMTGPTGEACIFDPAAYYGHREMDIAMTHLFGGYNQLFYDAYAQVSPLAGNFESRLEICNLYPLLVHLNLFGEGYLHRIENIVKKF